MPYTITPEQMASITDVEMAFATERFLPEWDDIPTKFKDGNLYTRLAEALCYGGALPTCDVEMHEGFDPAQMNRCVTAHLQSFGPKHEHKIAGVAFMISQACTLHPKEVMWQ